MCQVLSRCTDTCMQQAVLSVRQSFSSVVRISRITVSKCQVPPYSRSITQPTLPVFAACSVQCINPLSIKASTAHRPGAPPARAAPSILTLCKSELPPYIKKQAPHQCPFRVYQQGDSPATKHISALIVAVAAASNTLPPQHTAVWGNTSLSIPIQSRPPQRQSVGSTTDHAAVRPEPVPIKYCCSKVATVPCLSCWRAQCHHPNPKDAQDAQPFPVPMLSATRHVVTRHAPFCNTAVVHMQPQSSVGRVPPAHPTHPAHTGQPTDRLAVSCSSARLLPARRVTTCRCHHRLTG